MQITIKLDDFFDGLEDDIRGELKKHITEKVCENVYKSIEKKINTEITEGIESILNKSIEPKIIEIVQSISEKTIVKSEYSNKKNFSERLR